MLGTSGKINQFHFTKGARPYHNPTSLSEVFLNDVFQRILLAFESCRPLQLFHLKEYATFLRLGASAVVLTFAVGQGFRGQVDWIQGLCFLKSRPAWASVVIELNRCIASYHKIDP